ncbi:CaiB/BaiF CoA transferase family protein [Anaerofustis stercorihominis]|uniref:CaiB/BaiF CoA transferase family protein n=1 Tax=Anaerofustis stercorihominis TaxID=214853 RepID=UPI00214B9095|nr:CaiB/BaiF CoA-transferase family protein [Anaerofustis stercorihominis]MCR2032475.1 CoA transferase [Anaerofustis stercorihominis]
MIKENNEPNNKKVRMNGALGNLKILDFSTLLPGPYASLLLADMGAKVIKISSSVRPDIVADYPPFVDDTNLSANQAWLGRNKKNLFFNLKNPKAIEIVKELIMEYDIILEQFRPGVMDKLGLGYEELKKINPKLIYCSLTGYGQTGPLSQNAGHDINYLARSGNMAHAGKENIGPVLTNMQIADVCAGSMNSVVGILAAVNYRNMTGEGQYIDISMYDGLIPFNAMDGAGFLVSGEEPKREKQRLNGGCIYDFYETKDGEYLSVGCLEPQFWREFCILIDREEYIEGSVFPEDIDNVKEDIKNIIKSKTRDEWMDIFSEKDVCVEPVLSLKEAFEDEHVKEREMVVEVKSSQNEDINIKQMGNPIKLSKCPAKYDISGYPLGHHTKEIITSMGYSNEEFEEMNKEGVF